MVNLGKVGLGISITFSIQNYFNPCFRILPRISKKLLINCWWFWNLVETWLTEISSMLALKAKRNMAGSMVCGSNVTNLIIPKSWTVLQLTFYVIKRCSFWGQTKREWMILTPSWRWFSSRQLQFASPDSAPGRSALHEDGQQPSWGRWGQCS